mgnify:CR=1 FL=1
MVFFFQAEDGIRDLVRSRGLGDVYKRQGQEAIAKGGLKNVVGTLAMARTNDPQSATAQFFILSLIHI